MSLEAWVLAVDCCILTWLITTWFYEGHHKRCAVTVYCPKCKQQYEEVCSAYRKELDVLYNQALQYIQDSENK